MAMTGRDIKAFLTLDISKFNKGLTSARTSASTFKKELGGLNNTVGDLSNQSKKSRQDVDGLDKSVKNAGTSTKKTTSNIGGLKKSMGLLSITAGMLAITLGMELGMQILQVGRTAVNAQGQIEGMAKGMNWSAQQTKAYIDEMGRLQAIYKKTDMNAVGTEVAKMARIYKLNADEAKDFIETSAVFSSAMAGEGRSARDSALALKDLIDQGQGWERRLSEIGVTGDALKKTGLWSGDKNDKKGIIAALNQVLEERSLSQMAKEINSLDDALNVLTIAGGQLLGAVLIPAAPLIYGVVMALADLAYGSKAAVEWFAELWNALPGSAQIVIISLAFAGLAAIILATVIPAVATFVTTTLPTLISSLLATELPITIFGATLGAALWPILAIGLAIGAIIGVIYEAGKAMGWWTDIGSMGQAVWAGLQRIWSSFANNPAVINFVNQLKKAWDGLMTGLAPVTGFFTDFWNKIFPQNDGEFDIVRTIIDAFGQLGNTISWVFNTIQSNPVLNTLFTILLMTINPVFGLIYAFEQLGEYFGLWEDWGGMLTIVGGVISSILTSIGGVLSWLGAGFMDFIGIISGISGAITGGIGELFGAFFDDEGKFVGVIEGLNNVGQIIYTWILNLGIQIGTWMNSVDWIGLLTGVGEMIWGAIFGGGPEGGPNIGQRILGFFMSINWIGLFTQIGGFISMAIGQFNPITMIVTLLFGEAAGQKVATGITNFINYFVSLPGRLWVWLMSTIQRVVSFANSIREKARKAGSDFLNGLKEKIMNTPQMVYDELMRIKDKIGQVAMNLYNEAKNLGGKIYDGVKQALGISSPGYMYWMITEELGRMETQMDDSATLLGAKAGGIGQSMVNGFGSPKLDMGAAQPITPPVTDLTAFNTNAQNATLTAQNTAKTTTSTFNGMNNNLTSTFNNMGAGVNNSYNQMKNKTLSTMNDLKRGTNTEIGNVVGSWTSMKTSLIESAAHIRTKTASHINKLQGNMAGFWKKVRNPVLLLSGSAGPSPRTITTRPSMGGFAGPSPYGRNNTTGSRGLKLLNRDPMPCFNPEGCYAGWDYNWSPNIQGNVNSWKTNFGSIYDPYLNIGKFTDSNFPVKGNGNVYEALAMDMIGQTSYAYYFNSNGLSPAQNFLNGSFNCYDGALLLMSLASSFGLNSTMESGFWGNTGHVWANVEKVGRIDATAIQHGYGKFAHGKVHAGPSSNPAGLQTTTKATNNEFVFHNTFVLPENAGENQDVLLENIGERIENKIYEVINKKINGE
jgi:hypothetical protein